MTTYYSKNELIEILQNKARELGRLPKPEDMTEPAANVFLSYFKKWDKALKNVKISEKEVVKEPVKKAVPVEKTESAVKETVPVKPIEKKETTSACARRYSKEMIKELLLAEYKRLGKKPTRKEIDENKDLPTSGTCLKYFETTRIGDMWAEILGE